MRMTSLSTVATVLALGAVFVLGGCGADEDPSSGDAAARSGGSGGAAATHGGGGSSGGASSASTGGSQADEGGSSGGGGGVSGGGVAGSKENVRYDRDGKLHFVVVPRMYEVDRGRPILVDLVLKNVGPEPVRLVEPKKDLAGNFTLRVFHLDKRFVMRRRGWATSQDPKSLDIVTLEPGMSLMSTVDLQPMLSGTPGYATGGLKFEIEYKGAAHLAPAETGLWNADGKGFLRTPAIFVEVLTARWLEAFESDEEKLREHQATAINAARRWSPTNPKKEEMIQKLVEDGEPTVACLIALVEQMDQAEPEKHEVAGKAFDMLRHMPEHARAILARSVAEYAHPARAMLLAVFDEDARQAKDLPPSQGLAAVRTLAAGADTGSTLTVRVQGGTPNPVAYTLLPDGMLTVERRANGKVYTFTAQLGSKQLLLLKKALIDSRLWCWKGVRESPLPEEGVVDVGLRARSGYRFDVRLLENELRSTNCLSAPVMTVLDNLVGDVPPPPQAKPTPPDDK